jgi:ubiquinone/menaquinone biosynthesis C-methylase UbiE
MKHSQDHFSKVSKEYKDGRITYPKELYSYLIGLCDERDCSWDCATGSGQAANDLSEHFSRVIATDISDALLSKAKERENIEFRNATAEESGVPSGSVDLVTIAQAIHWFDQEAFWGEVKRVLKPNGILAYWGYVWPEVNDEIDSLLAKFKDYIASYWPERSSYLHKEYSEIIAPLKRINNPDFRITEFWSASQYLMHLSSWSGTRYHREASSSNPVSEIKNELNALWGDELRKVEWPLILQVYQKAELVGGADIVPPQLT